MGSLYGPFVLRVRTNLCSVTGKTGEGEKAVGRGARGSGLPSPRAAAFPRCMFCRDVDLSRLYFFCVVHSAALRHCEEGRRSNPEKPHPPNNVCSQSCSAAALSSPRWPVRWLGIYGCVTPFVNRSFIRRQVTLTPCERFQPPSLRGTKQSREVASPKQCPFTIRCRTCLIEFYFF